MTTSAHSPFKIGYARVNTSTQDEALQLDALQRACVDWVCIDRASGSVQDRPGLTSALECARSGDSLVVWRLDRLGRSLRHLIDVVHDLEQRGVALVSLTEQIDTSTPGGRCSTCSPAWRSSRRNSSGNAPWPGWPPPGPEIGSGTTDGVDRGQAEDGQVDAGQRRLRRHRHRQSPRGEPSIGVPGPGAATAGRLERADRMSCPDCAGTRAIPDDLTGGYQPCQSCVIQAGTTFVALDDPDGGADQS